MRQKEAAKSGNVRRPRRVASDSLPLRRLFNEHDNKVIEQLATAPSGTLELDRFVRDLRASKTEPSEINVIELRRSLIQIYIAAANFRANAKIPIAKLKSAEAALTSLWKAVSHLENIKPRHARGLAGVLNIPNDDSRGLDEWSVFAARSWDAKLAITEIAMALGKSLRTEKQKPSAKGERKKRLRVLVEALADWWIKVTGKTIAPYVQSKPLGNHRAFVAGRSGRFVEFSLSILSRLDGFKASEVISAIINVYERRRRGQSRQLAVKKS